MTIASSQLLALFFVLVLVGGCATKGDPRDPLEPFNRGVYQFNDKLDKAVVKPVAQGYQAAVPFPVRTAIGNFFSNLNDVVVALNNLFQFKLKEAASDAGRVLLNSTAGILGFIDVATPIGLDEHNEDFGQTLGWWGVETGPYLVLPLFGPSDFRDAGGLAVDVLVDPLRNYDELSVRDKAAATRVVSQREAMLDTEETLDTAALDRYQFLRDAYLQRRRALVYDGDPPRERLLDDDPEAPEEKPVLEPKREKTEAPAPEPGAEGQERTAGVEE
jgi:phospholipid-binding lipoprotein MlaA